MPPFERLPDSPIRTWAGLAFEPQDGSVYVSGGSYTGSDSTANLIQQGVPADTAAALSRPIYRLSYTQGHLAVAEGIDVPGMGEKRFAGGLACGKEGALFVVDINGNTVYRLSPSPRSVAAKAKVGYRPYAVALSPGGSVLAVANWGDATVSLLQPGTLAETARVKVGSHPNALCWASDGRLFVACGGENRVAVLHGKQVRERIDTALEPGAAIGSTPVALALSPDGNTLYVACADNNDVVVVDISRPGRSAVKGFIPTAWYPSALAVSPDGRKLYIGTGKGIGFRANYPGYGKQTTSVDQRTQYDYIGEVLSGTVFVVDVPDAQKLAAYTRQTRANMPPSPGSYVTANRIKAARVAFARIKHVLYIIRENRTFDQEFGDIPGGNRDARLTMYGEKITPNAHALARRTVLLDNLYCSGEVSEDGHQWCNSAYVTDFKARAWLGSYSGRGEPEDDGRLSQSPAGYLWDNCARHGLSYRSYGEFAWYTPSSRSARPVYAGHPTLNGHASLAWSDVSQEKDARDTDCAGAFIQELREAEKTGRWPRYMVMSLGEDHTAGLSPGAFTPFACVASNDLALGRIVEAFSHSRFWPTTAIFVIEDDAQDGPDHVDAHRTVGLVISPYIRRGVVDSTLYTTNSMVRTMELILNLPPMTQFDSHATPMYNAFTDKPDLRPYTALAARTDLMARNPKQGPAATQSTRLDFSAYDRADPAVLNRLLWEDAKPGTPMPAPVHSGILVR